MLLARFVSQARKRVLRSRKRFFPPLIGDELLQDGSGELILLVLRQPRRCLERSL